MAKGEIIRLHPSNPNWAKHGLTHCDDCDACTKSCTAHEVGMFNQRCRYCYYAPCACQILDNRYEESRYPDE